MNIQVTVQWTLQKGPGCGLLIPALSADGNLLRGSFNRIEV